MFSYGPLYVNNDQVQTMNGRFMIQNFQLDFSDTVWKVTVNFAYRQI
jgi:hypothetical protein